MKYTSVIILLIIFFSESAYCQHKLTIEISSLQNSDGNIVLELKDGNDNKIDGYTKKISDKKCIIIIKDLKPGKYAFRYFHDENKDNEFGTNWLGIPNEGFGFSNNATGTFGPPDFEDTIFEVKEDVTQKCTPIYL